MQVAQAARTNHGRINLATAKLCGCRQPKVKKVIDTCITIITTCDHTRRTFPRFCLADGYARTYPGTQTGQCNQQQGAAQGSASDTRVVELGRTSGTFRFDYRTFTNKDRIVIGYEGGTLFDSGCVATGGTSDTGTPFSQVLSYSGSSTQVTVQVTANCETFSQTNAWDYTVGCPS